MSSGHLQPAEINFEPDEKYAEKYRFFQGCPTILRTPQGRLYAGWYTGGTTEPSPYNCNLLVRSDDDGRTWSKPLLVIDSIPEQKIRAIDIQLWLDPQGRAWAFWVQRYDGCSNKDPRHLSLWAITSDDLDVDTPTWSEPRRISEGFLRCQPTALSDGRWLLFAYDWTCDRYAYTETADNGQTWQRRLGGKKVETPFDETMALERRDGSLWVLARTSLGYLAESSSFDGGKTWTDGCLTTIQASSSRFFLKRLGSGRVLLVCNNAPVRRTNMTAYLSEDDGRTWPHSLLIDTGENISYPDAVEGESGTIFLLHDHGRPKFKEIIFSRFTEADILAGDLVDPDSYLKQIISKAPGSPYDPDLYARLKYLETQWRTETEKLFGGAM